MIKNILLTIIIFSISSCANLSSQKTNNSHSFPEKWWNAINDPNTPGWEILPQEAVPGTSVILSKRNELGILSNFANTPFIYNDKKYQAIEGLWQSMKYPEGKNDVRAKKKGVSWKFTRDEVEGMIGFEAKRAGSLASKNMKKMGINWVTYKGKKMTYRTYKKSSHYQLIKKVMRAKLEQNPSVKNVLLATKDLILLPDHKTKDNTPPAWKYNVIWMELRAEMLAKETP